MDSSHWDVSTIDANPFEPQWAYLTTGTTFDVVVQVHCFGDNMSLATVVPSGRSCQICSTLPGLSGPGRFTLFGAVISSLDPLVLRVDSSSQIRAHILPCASSLPDLVEICAGLGGSSIGLEFSGFKLKAAVEWMPKLAALHQSMHPGVPVVVGDIGKPDTLRELHNTCPDPFSVMAGVSCQPYSRAGSQGGSSDPRSNTIPATCRLCHLFQVPILVLECVVPAKSNLFVRQHLNALKKLGYRILECVLQLEHVWAAHRLRWWVVACHPQLAIMDLPGFPSRSALVIRDLMPYIRDWPTEDIEQLQLSPVEQDEFARHSDNNLRKFGINLDTKMPTALHSWGNQVVSCACGCRDRLSTSLLIDKGLFAQLIPMKSGPDGSPRWRHPHPVEVALLNGMPPFQGWSKDQRLNLCGIGQVASPLHAVWIGANILNQVQKALGVSSPVDPALCLSQLQNVVYQQCRTLFPDIPKPRTSSCAVYWNQSVTPVIVQVGPSVTVSCLRAAEACLQNSDGTTWTFRDRDTSEILTEASLVAGRSLCVDLALPLGTPSLPPLDVATEMEVDFETPRGTQSSDLETRMVETPNLVPPAGVITEEHGVSAQGGSHLEPPVPTLTPLNEALLQLTAKPLTCLQPPLVTDPMLCASLLSQTMSPCDRAKILDHQDSVWGDDEIRWHLERFLSNVTTKVTILDPLLALGWHQHFDHQAVLRWISQAPATHCIVTCVHHQGHWTPIIWTDEVSHLAVHIWDHEAVDLQPFEALHQNLCRCLKLPQVKIVAKTRSFAVNRLCGAAAVAFIAAHVGALQLPRKESHLTDIHDDCRQSFRQHIGSQTVVARPWCWGAGTLDLPHALATLLTQHGVPNAAAESRAKLLLQSLGRVEVEKAILSSAPWKTLKAIANQHTPVVQLVLPDEILTKEKPAKGKGKTRRATGKGQSKNARSVIRPADLDPSKLVIEPGTFCCRDDQPLVQIPLTQVGHRCCLDNLPRSSDLPQSR